MTTGEILRVELQACAPERNLWRFYTIEAERDLFEDLIVKFNYGRIGIRGQTKTHIVQDVAAGVKLVRDCIK